ncbi:MAG: type I-E CRISPR-associated protein Cas6/Cse3/CasE [Pyrinomonadaceae bacterium MAG19_C2-C3]|nr:type I-E CRISPR-associated protein Cas6/Cse3/CasE [Pyrinomonadaceae bacterium MAG19_C2-C3]
MIFISMLRLDPMSRRVQTELSRCYEMHRTLCHAFPNLSGDEWTAARVLFRVDDDGGSLKLLVQSKHEPDWHAFSHHLNGARYLLATPQVKEWEPQFRTSQTLRFRLLANPTFRPKKNDGSDGERRGLYREAERLDWLARQSTRCGFALPQSRTTLRRNGVPLIFRGRPHDELTLDLPTCQVIDLNDGRRFPSSDRKIQFSAARFDGVLQVTDVELFRHALENGIGAAKGFGFGLLSVAPI